MGFSLASHITIGLTALLSLFSRFRLTTHIFSLSLSMKWLPSITAHIYTKWALGKCSRPIYLASTMSYWVMSPLCPSNFFFFLIVVFNLLLFKTLISSIFHRNLVFFFFFERLKILFLRGTSFHRYISLQCQSEYILEHLRHTNY